MEDQTAQFPEFRSDCPIASALDLFGDKWTLVVLRTIFVGCHKFGELAGVSERIATNILADRLDRLERFGLISRRAYQSHPPRDEYILTRAGADTLPILQAMAVWSAAHVPERTAPSWFLEAKAEAWYPDRPSGGAPLA